jgi:hypothetical protein
MANKNYKLFQHIPFPILREIKVKNYFSILYFPFCRKTADIVISIIFTQRFQQKEG